MMFFDKFKNTAIVYRCPLCGRDLSVSETGSFLCENRHCFDICAKGYVNFLTKPVRTKYEKELFQSRRAIFKDGFYEHILQGITELIQSYRETKPLISILDAGCGEGFYSLRLMERLRSMADIAALDIAKDAVVMAAKSGNEVQWMAADITNIPLKSKSIDVILNIFTPSSYSEFLRLLKADGIVIKAIPGTAYLKELREKAKEQLRNKSYSGERVTDHFEKTFKVIERRILSKTLPVTKEQLDDFIKMTPMMLDVRTDELDTKDIKSITIEAELIVGTNLRTLG